MSKKTTIKEMKDYVISQMKYGTRHPLKAFLRVIERGARSEGYIKDKRIYIALLGTTLDISLGIDIFLLVLPEYSIAAAISKIFFSYIFTLVMVIFSVIVGEEIYLICKSIGRFRK